MTWQLICNFAHAKKNRANVWRDSVQQWHEFNCDAVNKQNKKRCRNVVVRDDTKQHGRKRECCGAEARVRISAPVQRRDSILEPHNGLFGSTPSIAFEIRVD
jgi:hypothetical protein